MDDMAHMTVGPEGYTHYWTKAGAHTAYPANWSGTVKRVVLAAAIDAGKGKDADVAVIHDLADLPSLLPDITPKRRRLKIQDDAA